MVQFDSRLEATWAYFFNRVGWRWSYKPQLTLGGWSPSFVIFGNAKIFVDVQPFYHEHDWEARAAILLENYKKEWTREKHETIPEILLLGARLVDGEMALGPGFFLDCGNENDDFDEDGCEQPPTICMTSPAFFLDYHDVVKKKRMIGFGHSVMSYTDRIGSDRASVSDKNHGAWKFSIVDGQFFNLLWWKSGLDAEKNKNRISKFAKKSVDIQ